MSLMPVQVGSITYPESDGQPMADNTLQLYWILLLIDNLRALFRDRPDIFVGGNQNWYPVKGHPEVVNAPDAYVVFGRAKGHRSSWKQWEEADTPMTVVFEIRSPKNTDTELENKRHFYEDHGAEEYYLYDPSDNSLQGWLRHRTVFRHVPRIESLISPRLGVRFDLSGPEMAVYYPDGRPFVPFDQLMAAQERTERQLARLAELGRKARRQQATPEELRELEALEDETLSP